VLGILTAGEDAGCEESRRYVTACEGNPAVIEEGERDVSKGYEKTKSSFSGFFTRRIW